ncbi:MAG: NTP transferase domain-containing protein, partial [Candidatus Latescibacterota bacterium]|nr:NTP transferase domain-containing protein [Candidatus Latescibacterota bacterium]
MAPVTRRHSSTIAASTTAVSGSPQPMSDQQSLGIAILAGGRSRRFDGRPKGCLAVDGRPLLQRVIDAASP